MAQETRISIQKKTNNFISRWHNFPIDYWWRQKYKVPFGSKTHREMNFIDMLIEFQEDLEINKKITAAEKQAELDYESVGYTESDSEGAKMTQEEIDEEFEELELSQFDNKLEQNG